VKDSCIGVAVVSVMKEKNGHQTFYRALLRSADITTGVYLPSSHLGAKLRKWNKQTVLKNLFQQLHPMLAFKSFSKNLNVSPDLLLDFEDLELTKINNQKHFKWGVLYWKEGNVTEEDMLCNTTTSKEFEDFLSLLGERVLLRGWKQYNGGLDTKYDGTGSHSIFSRFEDNEIMFHVSTLLPFTPRSTQQVERKRHIGNDVVVIVFKESNSPYVISTVASQFTHIVIVVSVDKELSTDDNTVYRCALCVQNGVPFFGEPFPSNGRFFDKLLFRDFLFRKRLISSLSLS